MKEGTVVYFVNDNNWVDFGTYAYNTDTGIVVDLYQVKEHRLVEGIPFNDFKDTEWKPLPKHWTYNTELFKITDDPGTKELMQQLKGKRVDNPSDVLYCIQNGLIEKKPFEKVIESEVVNKQYRVIKKSPSWIYGAVKVTAKVNVVFFTYEEAKSYKKERDEKKNRECFEANIIGNYETLDYQLNRYEADHGGANIEKLKQQFLSLPRFCDIIIRYYNKELLWQYRNTESKALWGTMV